MANLACFPAPRPVSHTLLSGLMARLLAALLVLSVAAWLALPAPTAMAQLRIDVTQGNVDPMPIAIPDFKGPDGAVSKVGADIARVVRADLARSGLFKAIDPRAFLDLRAGVDTEPVFADWRTISAQALVLGKVEVAANNRLTADFYLWDIVAGKLVNLVEGSAQEGLSIGTPSSENWRKIAHNIADAIYARITGDKGYFDTRIVLVSESGPRTQIRKRLTIMDQDGANPSLLPVPGDIVLTPRFSPSGQQITYLSLSGGKPRVYLLNIETGRQEILGNFRMSYAPRFSPDGRMLVMSVDHDGNSEIHLFNLQTRENTRITNDPGIDTSPSFSPDGKRIVFNSDRSGSSQLFVMDADGSNARRISAGEGRYSTPVWSPRGDLVVFTKQLNGRFYIGVMAPDGKDERLLTEGYLVEGPDWAPNGRVIIFFREDGPGAGPKLWSIDLRGRNLQQIPTAGNSSDPNWSPLP